MNVLIITSEVLYPGNTIPSIFELSQAKILSASHQVAILSVRIQGSFSLHLKRLLGRITGRPAGEKFGFTLRKFLRSIMFLAFGKKYSLSHVIEGIPVFEGFGYNFRSTDDDKKSMKIWCKAGFTGYIQYEKKSGRPDIIHAHSRFLNAGLLALEVKRRKNIPFIYTEHSTLFQRGLVKTDLSDTIAEIIDHSSVYTAVSKSLLGHVEKYLGRSIVNALVLPNPVDRIYENTPVINDSQHPVFIFTCIGNLHKKKGIDLLIVSFKNAFENNPKFRLEICGDGSLMTELNELSEKYGLKNVVSFKGKLSREEVLKQIDNSHVLVSSSYVETFGVVVAEALARGKPVITTSSGGPEEFVTGLCGIVVETGNVKALSEAMIKIYSEYSGFRSDQIREYALSRFGSEVFRQKLTEIYQHALTGKN